MSRSKRDISDTESMLGRLASLLSDHCYAADQPYSEAVADAESLRRISMTLHRWHELECNADIQRFIRKRVDGKWMYIVAEESGFPYLVSHDETKPHYTLLADREAGARKRLANILKRYPGLQAYVQTDPRGCALYILKPGAVPEGSDVSSCYSRGLAVHQ